MKYIKTFEYTLKINPDKETGGAISSKQIFKSEQKFWKIMIDDYFFIRLEKIGVPEEIQNDIYDFYCELQEQHKPHEFKFVFVGKDDYGGETFDWHWNFNQIQNIKDVFYAETSADKYEYQGEVEITQQDIDDWKFKNDTKKYNL